MSTISFVPSVGNGQSIDRQARDAVSDAGLEFVQLLHVDFTTPLATVEVEDDVVQIVASFLNGKVVSFDAVLKFQNCPGYRFDQSRISGALQFALEMCHEYDTLAGEREHEEDDICKECEEKE